MAVWCEKTPRLNFHRIPLVNRRPGGQRSCDVQAGPSTWYVLLMKIRTEVSASAAAEFASAPP